MTWTSALMRSWYGVLQCWFCDCFLGYPLLSANRKGVCYCVVATSQMIMVTFISGLTDICVMLATSRRNFKKVFVNTLIPCTSLPQPVLSSLIHYNPNGTGLIIWGDVIFTYWFMVFFIMWVSVVFHTGRVMFPWKQSVIIHKQKVWHNHGNQGVTQSHSLFPWVLCTLGAIVSLKTTP
jgi:hypothetical protein